jgi:phosphate transport system substrate-binding protein
MIVLIAGIICVLGSAEKEAVSVSGSTTVLPLVEPGAEAFNTDQSHYQVLVTGGGTGVGIKNIALGTSDIAMASREVTPEEKAQFGDKFKENLIGYDGIAIAVSKEILDSGVSEMTRETAKKIYSGEIKNWKDLGGPDEEIFVIAREQGSGTRDTFNEVIMGDKKAETPGVSTVAGSNAEIKTAITGNKNAIGYLGFSYVEDGKVGVISLDGVKPSASTIKSQSYELSRKLYLYTFEEPTPGAQAFIEFMKGPNGQKIAGEYGFLTL